MDADIYTELADQRHFLNAIDLLTAYPRQVFDEYIRRKHEQTNIQIRVGHISMDSIVTNLGPCSVVH